MLTNIEQNIRHIRELKELTQEYVVSELNISTRAYSKIELGETQLTIKRLNQISAVLGITAKEIIGFDPSLVFNNNSTNQQGGEFIAYNNTEIKHLKDLYEGIIKEKNKIIDELRRELEDALKA